MTSDDTDRTRVGSLWADQRGTATTEAALVMIPLLVFLLLSPAILKIWETEHEVRVDAHRDLFHKLTAPVEAGVPGALTHAAAEASVGALWGKENLVSVPSKLIGNEYGTGSWRIFTGTTAVVGETRLPNTYAEGWAGETVSYGRLATFEGELKIERRAFAIRSPWTRPDAPYVSTQVTTEGGLVDAWFKSREKEAMAFWMRNGVPYGDIRPGLKVQDTLMEFAAAYLRDDINKRAKDTVKKTRKTPPPTNPTTPVTPPDAPSDDAPESITPLAGDG